jgi:IS30 family transposase
MERSRLLYRTIKGRLQFSIKQFVIANPFATVDEILAGRELNCSKSTVSRFLKRHGMPTGKAKARTVVRCWQTRGASLTY